ncbi:MAG: exo-beta-N-acetylmuramidase NamZ domain-containing protein [Bacteroidota bacterium]
MFEYKKLSAFLLFCICGLQLIGQVITGAEQTKKYIPMLKNKRVALVVNQTSVIGNTHLVDSLKKLKVDIRLIFAPEHGFRGNYGAGIEIKSGKDAKTGLTVISLYGKNKKPSAADMAKIDVVIFDIQDVGARFYTYISTLHYVMEACTEHKKILFVLDRPNPNGFYIDGPLLDTAFRSFVGMHPVPIVHGMTVGEYASMINGEKWLGSEKSCLLNIITMIGYDHNTRYSLPVKPSPNLPTMNAIYLYPGLCLFEGTNYSMGRGTNKPFECIGKPGLTHGNYTFTPKPIKGVAENPPYAGKECKGYLLSDYVQNVFMHKPQLNIGWLIDMYAQDTAKSSFFNDFFPLLAGGKELQQQIESGMSESEIRKSWQPGLQTFYKIRMKYLLYKEFSMFNK